MNKLKLLIIAFSVVATTFGGDLFDVTYTIYKESAGESTLGKRAVATVIVNRSINRGTTPQYECKKYKQFSCWNNVSTPIVHLNNSIDCNAWNECLRIAIMVVDQKFIPLGNWDHYYNPDKCTPSWGNSLYNVVIIGNHKFGKL